MNKCIVKKIVLFVSILLFIVGADTYGWDGPCLDADDGCGGFYVGPETCKESWHWEPPCSGSCPRYVPEGAPNEYCAGLWGECTEDYGAFCSTIKTYKCVQAVGYCACVETGTGYDFERTDC